MTDRFVVLDHFALPESTQESSTTSVSPVVDDRTICPTLNGCDTSVTGVVAVGPNDPVTTLFEATTMPPCGLLSDVNRSIWVPAPSRKLTLATMPNEPLSGTVSTLVVGGGAAVYATRTPNRTPTRTWSRSSNNCR